MEKNIYDLEINETTTLDGFSFDTAVRRVPGGWIYTMYALNNDMGSSVFVPLMHE